MASPIRNGCSSICSSVRVFVHRLSCSSLASFQLPTSLSPIPRSSHLLSRYVVNCLTTFFHLPLDPRLVRNTHSLNRHRQPLFSLSSASFNYIQHVASDSSFLTRALPVIHLLSICANIHSMSTLELNLSSRSGLGCQELHCRLHPGP
jgi:hypothetical protein